jgi:dihydropteroate synthase
MQLMALPKKTLRCKGLSLDLSTPQIMGILNVTPDSFSDGGLYQDQAQALRHAQQMIKDGASIIDIGGESTRPHATAVSVAEELQRVIPVVEALAQHQVWISVDTSQPEVIEAAVQAGAHIWNDVRALSRPKALETAAKLAIPVVLMHMRGDPQNMNELADYQHVESEVIQELQARVDQALAAGVRAEHIILDPGFGFAKNTQHNLQLLQQLWQLQALDYPVLAALSRKRFIGELLAQSDPKQRVVGSVAAHLLAIQQGASIIRVHDVKASADALKIWQAMQMQ